jgi:hypothetical protein
MNTSANSIPLRRLVYTLLITLLVGSVGGRILSVARVYEPYLSRDEADPKDQRGRWPATRPEPMPTHGDNDRSRWDTVRALVDNGTYAIGHRDRDPATGTFKDSGVVSEDGWRTIDKVLRPDTQDFYSSKPPLLPTIVAGEYWLLKKTFGWSIAEHRWSVVPIILLTFNLLPFVIYLLLLARLLEKFGTSDWGRLYVLAAACFGTFLTAFAITLNNHTVAACSALFALYPALRIYNDGQRNPGLYILTGLFAGFTAANELPATAFAAALFLLLFFHSPWRTVFFYIPGVLLPLAALLVTNYLAIGDYHPAYEKFGTPWYEFEGSYWKLDPGQVKHGIDWAYQSESRAMYAFHVLVGHHGLFSLSPIFLFAVAGMLSGLTKQRGPMGEKRPDLRMVAVLTLFLTTIVLGFYIVFVDVRTHNYGGWTSGLRWLLWLTPFWLLTMLPVADWLSERRWGRGVAYIFLAISVLSVSYPAWNPWRHPWLYNLLEWLGWIRY